jgi:hypothetical protein
MGAADVWGIFRVLQVGRGLQSNHLEATDMVC